MLLLVAASVGMHSVGLQIVSGMHVTRRATITKLGKTYSVLPRRLSDPCRQFVKLYAAFPAKNPLLSRSAGVPGNNRVLVGAVGGTTNG